MAKTVTAAEMKERERAANEAGLLYIQMMENAGRAAYAELKRRVPALRRLLIVAGKGNNGGDGFVMARVAAKEGAENGGRENQSRAARRDSGGDRARHGTGGVRRGCGR